MNKYPDWYLITDVKDDNLRALKEISEIFGKNEIDLRNRVVPQVYSPDEIPRARALGFENIILTLYRFGNNKTAVREIIAANPVWAVTLWANW
jgi:glycerophosphoryl diester phosphodiesterase